MKYDFYSSYWDEENMIPLFDEIDQIGDNYYIAKLYKLSCMESSVKIRATEKYKQLFLNYRVDTKTLDLMETLSMREPHYVPDVLPKSAFYLHVKFTLSKPYLSRDDEEFYIHENPVVKEKVFKVPCIRASSWKGNLLWAAKVANNLPEDDKRILRIFGNKKGEENQENLRKGRLYTYPTFFDKISLDIINPHDRETRTGKNPITLEVVPCGTEGDLFLLYVPFDKIGDNENEVKEEIKEDLLYICRTIKALLTEYGISSKRTSGYGTARIRKIEFKSKLLRGHERCVDLDELINELNGKNLKNREISSGGGT